MCTVAVYLLSDGGAARRLFPRQYVSHTFYLHAALANLLNNTRPRVTHTVHSAPTLLIVVVHAHRRRRGKTDASSSGAR